MRHIIALVAVVLALYPAVSRSAAVGYSITVTTAYATSDPFPNRLDDAFTEADTGYLEIANTGETTFSGVVGTIAVSAFAGDLSFTSDPLVLAEGAVVSIAIPDNSANVGGFNGPAYFQRPGVEITVNGTISDGTSNEPVNLLVADADIHSGVPNTDQYTLTSDSYVLQGGDPWGFDTGATFGLNQADGVYVFSQAVPEPGSLGLFAVALSGCAVPNRLLRKRRSAGNPDNTKAAASGACREAFSA